MFNDRDLAVLGGGALGAILCLMLPWSFAAKVVVAVLLLVVSLALAFARFGLDRLTLEQYFKRQLMFRLQPRRYSYFRRGEPNRAGPQPAAAELHFAPISFRLDETGLYWLMTVWLAVVGAYVLYWAHSLGGLQLAAFWLKQIVR